MMKVGRVEIANKEKNVPAAREIICKYSSACHTYALPSKGRFQNRYVQTYVSTSTYPSYVLVQTRGSFSIRLAYRYRYVGQQQQTTTAMSGYRTLHRENTNPHPADEDGSNSKKTVIPLWHTLFSPCAQSRPSHHRTAPSSSPPLRFLTASADGY
eukprot:11880945-Ditylum_brightwellii.AAC.1